MTDHGQTFDEVQPPRSGSRASRWARHDCQVIAGEEDAPPLNYFMVNPGFNTLATDPVYGIIAAYGQG